mmetsp:Transcript_26760/g.58185  ORF Transcript_26760/g.58185 Transcript_26760/m.58185 type:complete len:281 (+) Transcript_26760:74-916(+)|eukprot:CAMPEP_0206544022 /NCGR_PEP_ID=MMETSP0325_2-20121206/11255_1 /ASSEMBLY_ACC=CAM_ASM_000347 /TAXON_ID=2866 /ORGANISM="Crypthecodinium cohnii, Strain Seligo" /LENGTH=280 /DNA_ID=CAMNT_0054042661 /DNA_START=45 /DNA_END=887 /DNA_ORIENTATION=-
MSTELSELQNLAFGMACAPVFTIFLQPTIFLKHARMQGLPLSFCPRVLWRGTPVSIFNETGQAGVQFLTTGIFRKLILGDANRRLTTLEDISAASMSGIASAVYVSPVELVMVQQQRYGGTMVETFSRMLRNRGIPGLMRGFVPTAARDSVYVAGMLSITPLFENLLEHEGLSHHTAVLVGSCASGSLAGSLSCPFDCVKACMKGDLEETRYGSMTDTTRKLMRSGGISRFFHGVEWRCINLSTSFLTVALARRLLDYYGVLDRQTTDFPLLPSGVAHIH